MNKYEKARLAMMKSYEAELSELDLMRTTLSEKEYWDQYNEIISDYNEKIHNLDAQQRADEVMLQGKNSKNSVRPEASYPELVGQLKAEKMASLIADLSRVASEYRDVEISPDDPFYDDKKNPLDVFERWWLQEMDKLPSVAEVKDFLSRIHINSRGYIVFDYETEAVQESPSTILADTTVRDSIKASLKKTAKQKKAEAAQAELQRYKRNNPLMAKYAESILAARKKVKSAAKRNQYANSLHSIVEAYTLPESLSDLLHTHIDKVCIPKGLIHVDKYQSMLDQFLRYVQTDTERKQVINQAIKKGWRILSNGKY